MAEKYSVILPSGLVYEIPSEDSVDLKLLNAKIESLNYTDDIADVVEESTKTYADAAVSKAISELIPNPFPDPSIEEEKHVIHYETENKDGDRITALVATRRYVEKTHSNAISQSNSFTLLKTAEFLKRAEDYTDSSINALHVNVKAESEVIRAELIQRDLETLASANKYTDISNEKLIKYIDEGDTSVLEAAMAYTDLKTAGAVISNIPADVDIQGNKQRFNANDFDAEFSVRAREAPRDNRKSKVSIGAECSDGREIRFSGVFGTNPEEDYISFEKIGYNSENSAEFKEILRIKANGTLTFNDPVNETDAVNLRYFNFETQNIENRITLDLTQKFQDADEILKVSILGTVDSKVDTSVASSKAYTDLKIDTLRSEVNTYADSKCLAIKTELSTSIEDARKIAISGDREYKTGLHTIDWRNSSVPIILLSSQYVRTDQKTLTSQVTQDPSGTKKTLGIRHNMESKRLEFFVHDGSSGVVDSVFSITHGLIDAGNLRMINLSEPVSGTDAATKQYVDTKSSGGSSTGFSKNATYEFTKKSLGVFSNVGVFEEILNRDATLSDTQALIKVTKNATNSNYFAEFFAPSSTYPLRGIMHEYIAENTADSATSGRICGIKTGLYRNLSDSAVFPLCDTSLYASPTGPEVIQSYKVLPRVDTGYSTTIVKRSDQFIPRKYVDDMFPIGGIEIWPTNYIPFGRIVLDGREYPASLYPDVLWLFPQRNGSNFITTKMIQPKEDAPINGNVYVYCMRARIEPFTEEEYQIFSEHSKKLNFESNCLIINNTEEENISHE